MDAQNHTLSDVELDAVSGGKKEQVTVEQYEQILAQMIKNSSTKGGGSSGAW